MDLMAVSYIGASDLTIGEATYYLKRGFTVSRTKWSKEYGRGITVFMDDKGVLMMNMTLDDTGNEPKKFQVRYPAPQEDILAEDWFVIVDERKLNYNLIDTCRMMNSSDYKERFKAEYFQLKIRVEGLESMLLKYKEGTLSFKPSCSYDLLKSQLNSMISYGMILEKRAKIEEIPL